MFTPRQKLACVKLLKRSNLVYGKSADIAGDPESEDALQLARSVISSAGRWSGGLNSAARITGRGYYCSTLAAGRLQHHRQFRPDVSCTCRITTAARTSGPA